MMKRRRRERRKRRGRTPFLYFSGSEKKGRF
jgi:hypothetical protein